MSTAVESRRVEERRSHPASRARAQRPLRATEVTRLLDSVAVEGLAESSGVTPHDIVAMLPKQTRSFASASKFIEVMDDVTAWGEVTVLLRTVDGCIEITTSLPKGELVHGYFHWLGNGKIRGHLRHDRCGSIAFVERSFMGCPSASVLFFNREGNIMFKVLVARDERNTPHEDQLRAFRALALRVSWPHYSKTGENS